MSAAITINFRKAELTIECVRSLLRDGWSPIVVWDNSDDMGESIGEVESIFAGKRDIHIVKGSANLGFAAGVNRALDYLDSHDYVGPVLLINNDALVSAGLRELLEAQIREVSSPALIAPRIHQAGREQGWMYYQPWLGLVSERPIFGGFRYLSGCCLFVNRARNAPPLFDESFFMYGEDVELCRRSVTLGGRLILLGEACVSHLGSASSGQATVFYERQLVRAHWLLAGKLASGPISKLAMRALRVPVLASRACLRAIRFHSWEPIKALTGMLH